MEVMEQARGPDEAIKAHGDPMSVDVPAQDPPLPNGHDLKASPTYPSENATTTTQHVNGFPPVANDAPQPVTNGVSELSLSQSQNPPVSLQEPAPSAPIAAHAESSLPSTAPPVEPEPPSDPILADVVVAPSQAPIDSAPPVVQPPTSDLREEVPPADPQRVAEMQEQKQIEDLAAAAPVASQEVTAPVEAAAVVSQDDSLPEKPATATPTLEFAKDAFESVTPAAPVDSSVEIKSIQVPDHPPVPIPAGVSTEVPLEPAPTPIPQAEAPKSPVPAPVSVPAPMIDSSVDQVMQDAPASPAKISRERDEEENGDEPSAKRAKTDPETPTGEDFKKPELPAENAEESTSQTAAPDQTSRSSMTKPQHKHLVKTVGNVKRITAAKMFLVPVDYVALNLPSYPTIISKPMDLKTLEDNLRADKYSTVDAVVADFNQIVENSRLFNGPEHPVTAQANVMKASFDKSMEKIPGPDVIDAGAGERKKKAIEPGPVKIPPPRRESRSSLPGSARSPGSAVSPHQTFALNPDGLPLIRRDSTVDGRPKREIHRPAPKDLPYSNQKPKKKKYQWELKFCEKVLNELMKPKYHPFAFPFKTAVDPVALNIPTYHSVVKKPMDFGTIAGKLEHGEYENAKDFEADSRLVFQNCYKFNPPGDVIHNSGKELEKLFDAEWAKKREWLENNTPSSGPQSPGTTPEPEESEVEEEEEEEEEEDQSELQKLQQHIAALSKQVELIQKKKKSPPAPSKKSSKTKPAKKETKKSASAAPKSDKKSAPKTKKEKAPYVTYEQKQDISTRINSLSEAKMAQALKIIRDNMPNLKGVQDDEIELDIDELSNEVLYKLLVFVRKHAPRDTDSPPRPAPAATSSSAAPARKKNKPMSKHEQEARIAQVQNSLSAYNQGSPPAHATSRPGHNGDDSDGSSGSESSEEE